MASKPAWLTCLRCVKRTPSKLKSANDFVTEIPAFGCNPPPTRVYCDACIHEHRVCEMPGEARIGDLHDLMALLDWTKNLLKQNTLQAGTSDTYVNLLLVPDKKRVISHVHDFVHESLASEEVHREQFALNCKKSERDQNGATDRYNTVAAQRRATLQTQRPAPQNGTGDELQTWAIGQHPRLVYGDRGFLGWANAKTTFVDEVLAIIEEKNGQLVLHYKRSLPTGVIVYS